MLKLGLVGCGAHSRKQHLPALKELAARQPGEIELVAVCDLRFDAAQAAQREIGFRRAYASIDEMLAAEQLDGCIAVTPQEVTAAVARRFIEAGIPLLMEKPPGATLEEATALCELGARHGARVMVSMNRRFDPAVNEALAWIGGRPIERLRATMLRSRRTEATFIYGTGIHIIDTARAIAGDVRDFSSRVRRVGGVAWFDIALEFASGAAGTIEIMPTCGCQEETYELLGAEWRAVARVGLAGAGEIALYERGRLIRHDTVQPGAPECVACGSYGELAEFTAAIREGRAPRPAPADTLQTVAICEQLLAGIGQ